MLKRTILLLLLGAAATPLAAQSAPDLNARVGKIEKELRAVQRKVFPDGQPLEPEIVAPKPAPEPIGGPASSPVADLTARVDAIETQLRALTAHVEQNGHRVGQLEDQVKQLVADAQARAAAEAPPAALVPPSQIDQEAPPAPAVERPSTGDPAEDGYIYGFRLWQAKAYGQAETELKRVADKYPDHRRASFAQNLLGRAYLDDGKPALAAVALYDSYKKWPKGERAAESLYWLGQALTQLKKPADACKVYAQFGDDYGAAASASLKAQVAAGRKQAKCG
ncbi:tetratricopeptide repeat protein [Sphingomonas sp. MAH-20]|jgi:TolA-binding protein|uniref:Tetratricopeptide repeat protein n=1 Tax=Sphingomonas horti TaxID=2682842 RepID=A0A6I4J3F0_9SPHN|nr:MULTISPECIES: tetratricopeptide repeat protein [Sphingomonas]MBA2919219.1 tetratricopeptide repeat protein [Sphingomonas sp. CGMCC 1.13658]MVO79252.1 tetratricopeptide repeat protein [Sphingomonas horti]